MIWRVVELLPIYGDIHSIPTTINGRSVCERYWIFYSIVCRIILWIKTNRRSIKINNLIGIRRKIHIFKYTVSAWNGHEPLQMENFVVMKQIKSRRIWWIKAGDCYIGGLSGGIILRNYVQLWPTLRDRSKIFSSVCKRVYRWPTPPI